MISWSSIAQTARSACWLMETALWRFLIGEMMIGGRLWLSTESSSSESGGIAASSQEKSSCVAIWNISGCWGVLRGSATPQERPRPPLNPLGGMVTGWATKMVVPLLIWHDKRHKGADWCQSFKLLKYRLQIYGYLRISVYIHGSDMAIPGYQRPRIIPGYRWSMTVPRIDPSFLPIQHQW